MAWRILAGVLLVLSIAGCRSTCLIDSDPQGALVKVDDEVVGQTPVTYGFSNSGFRDTYKVEASKEGYETEVQLVHLQANAWGPRSWPSNVFMRLRKLGQK